MAHQHLTLCGSARFEAEFHKWNEALTLAGHVVYSLAVFPSQKTGNPADHEWYTEEQKTMLDKVHRRKIKHSEGIVVLNPGGYVGESTFKEIMFAADSKRAIYWLVEPDAEMCRAVGMTRKRYNRPLTDLIPEVVAV